MGYPLSVAAHIKPVLVSVIVPSPLFTYWSEAIAGMAIKQIATKTIANIVFLRINELFESALTLKYLD